jgi:universal stress protein E
MTPFKSILVDIDASVAIHPALDRAVGLARTSGATITIADVMTIPAYDRRYLPPSVEEEMIEDRRSQLQRVLEGVSDVAIRARLLFGRPATALIQEVLRDHHDLLMRSHARDVTARQSPPFGAVDMELLRKCPCPVFLVRQSTGSQHRQVVGAVNASTAEDPERTLNIKLVELTLLMAELERSTPVLLHAWRPYAEHKTRTHSLDDAFAVYVDQMRQRTAADLRQLVESFGDRLSGVRTVHRRGKPEDVIAEFVAAHGVDLVVMGTVARGGIPGFLIGNTAERMLARLACSVLAVKPDEFVTPVRLDTV